jgi:hypothetical protein
MTFQRWGKTQFTVRDTAQTARTILVQGRDRWALEILTEAGPRWVTAIEMNGPRLHAFIFDLHHEHSLNIVREDEPHGGDFPSHHGRYFLLSKVKRKLAEGLA